MPFFDIFASPRWSLLRMRTEMGLFFIIFQNLSHKKIKALQPKMTKIASTGSCLVARPSCDIAASQDSDPLLDRKRIAIERVQSSEFNRLRHGQSIGCNGFVLNRIVCDRLIWDVWQLCQWQETVLFVEQKRARWPPFFFLSHFQGKCIRKVLAVFEKKILGTVFLLQRFGVVNPWTCNWNTYKRLQLSTAVFDLSFWKSEHGDPQFFCHRIWNSHELKDRYSENQPISRQDRNWAELPEVIQGGWVAWRVSGLNFPTK